jgi:hypothetical protein
MKKSSWAALVLGCFSVVGCGGSGSEAPASRADQHLNVAPATLADAAAELKRADSLLAAGADEAELLADLTQLRERMEELNGRVASIEIGPEHVVNFYQDASGSLVMGERAPLEAVSVFAALDLSKLSAAEVFLELAPDREVPEALLRNPAATSAPVVEVEAQPQPQRTGALTEHSDGLQVAEKAAAQDSLGRSQEALTSADGPYFRDRYCQEGNIYFFCRPNRTGSLTAYAGATHSKVVVAPYAGGGAVTSSLTVGGDAIGSFATFMGERQTFYGISGWRSVRDSGCCGICACGTHAELWTVEHRWHFGASGKSYHVGGRFLFDPLYLDFQ